MKSKLNAYLLPQQRQCLRLIFLLILQMAVLNHSFAAPVTLNLKDASISAVISTVSEVTGKNFIVDPRVKGKVTIVSSRPMDSDEVYQVFLSILAVHGFSAIPSGNIIKIVPAASAKQGALPVASDEFPGEGEAVVTRVIELNSVPASQLVPILRPLVPQQGHLAAYAPSNILIISDHADNIERLIKIIRRIDTPSGDKIEVIILTHASASDVVRILNSLEQKSKGKKRAGSAPILVADERTNSILIGGARAGRLRLKTIISHLDTPLAAVGNTHVVYLRYAQAKDLVPLLSGVSASVVKQKQAKTQSSLSGKAQVNIQADENTNSLVITASPSMFRSLQTVIQKLDIRRAQVQVETVIAEVSENLASELGVQWAIDGTPGGKGPVGVSNLGAASSSIAGIAGTIAAGGVPSLGAGLTLGIGTFNSSSLNFAALLRALKGDGTTNILSTPLLVTLDNEEAEIVVGQTVPFLTGSFVSAGTTGSPTNPFQTIKRENVGITLKIKPQINAGDAIKLDIEQTVDSLAASAVSTVDVVTNTRSIKTSVIVNDGEMIVLGGLIDDTVKETVQKVPILGDVPLLGLLFKYKSTSNEKKNLMVFMRPVIIRDAAVGAELTSSKYNYIRAKQIKIREKGLLFLPDESSPLLPPIDEYLAFPPKAAASMETLEGGAGTRLESPILLDGRQ